jgi:hypothetical protein
VTAPTGRRGRRVDAAFLATGALVAAHGFALLRRKWDALEPAVFEADTYAQGYLHALHVGSAWPWDLTQDFWPFFLMAPGLYLFLPLAAVAPGGWPPLVVQGVGLVVGALLVAALARRARPDAPLAAGWLGLAFLVHPATAVGFAWGWSPYATAVPLLLVGAALLARGAPRAGLFAWALAASLKINVAMAVGGLAVAALALPRASADLVLPGLAPRARRLAEITLAWGILAGGGFVAALLAVGRAAEDLHLSGDARPPLWAGVLTVVCVAGPLWPLLRRAPDDGGGSAPECTAKQGIPALTAAVERIATVARRGAATLGAVGLLAALGAGPELAYTVLNAANSGLLPATAVLFLAAIGGLRAIPDPTAAARAARAVFVLVLIARAVYHPPVVSPLPLTPAAFARASAPADAGAAALRAWLAAAPDDLPVIVDPPLLNVVGEHPGRVTRPHGHAGGPAVLLLTERRDAPLPPSWEACLDASFETSATGRVRAGVCDALPTLAPPLPPGHVAVPGR